MMGLKVIERSLIDYATLYNRMGMTT